MRALVSTIWNVLVDVGRAAAHAQALTFSNVGFGEAWRMGVFVRTTHSELHAQVAKFVRNTSPSTPSLRR